MTALAANIAVRLGALDLEIANRDELRGHELKRGENVAKRVRAATDEAHPDRGLVGESTIDTEPHVRFALFGARSAKIPR